MYHDGLEPTHPLNRKHVLGNLYTAIKTKISNLSQKIINLSPKMVPTKMCENFKPIPFAVIRFKRTESVVSSLSDRNIKFLDIDIL